MCTVYTVFEINSIKKHLLSGVKVKSVSTVPPPSLQFVFDHIPKHHRSC